MLHAFNAADAGLAPAPQVNEAEPARPALGFVPFEFIVDVPLAACSH